MMNPASTPLTVVIRCDAMAAFGVGHLIRQIALAEELVGRGHKVVFRGHSDIPWAVRQLELRGYRLESVLDGNDSAEVGSGAQVVILDGYELPPALGAGLRDKGIMVMAMVDGSFGRGQEADLYVDQNLGAQVPEIGSGRWLVGPEYALLRDSVRSLRGVARKDANATPRVLIVFGGSDPFRGAPIATQLLLDTGAPVHALVIAADLGVVAEISDFEYAQGQTVEVLSRVDDLPALATTCDLAISAAGSTVWELAVLRVPTALVAVVDNQEAGYRAATRSLTVGLGFLDELRVDAHAREAAVEALSILVRDGHLRRQLGEAAGKLIDGDGRRRVADAIEEMAY